MDPENDESNSEASQDALEELDFDTESEMSLSDEEFERDEYLLRPRMFYSGKDGTRWQMRPLPVQRAASIVGNVVTRAGTLTQAGRTGATVLSSWNLLFTDNIIEYITRYTNVKIAMIRENFQNNADAADTNTNEIKALIGLLLLAGMFRMSHANMEDVYDMSDGLGIEIFHLTMPLRRFYFLLRAIRFDNVNNRVQRRATDRLAAVRRLVTDFARNIRHPYQPGDRITLDEMIEPFKGRCPFKVYLKNKPHKYGIKVNGVADSETHYLLNFEIYAGRQPEGDYRVSNATKETAERLLVDYYGSRRTVTMDNYFTSFPLFEELLRNNLFACGTMNKNKTVLPPLFTNQYVAPGESRKPRTSMFGHNRTATLVSYCNDAGKVVLVMSSDPAHQHQRVNEDNAQKKPEVLEFYNATKGGIDTIDQLRSSYTVSRQSNRWPVKIFYFLLDVSAINGWVIFNKNRPRPAEEISRRTYLKDLALALVRPHVIHRLSVPQTPFETKRRIEAVFHIAREVEPAEEMDCDEPRRGVCYLCPSSLRRRTQTKCIDCNRYICRSDHTRPLCSNCEQRRVVRRRRPRREEENDGNDS